MFDRYLFQAYRAHKWSDCSSHFFEINTFTTICILVVDKLFLEVYSQLRTLAYLFWCDIFRFGGTSDAGLSKDPL